MSLRAMMIAVFRGRREHFCQLSLCCLVAVAIGVCLLYRTLLHSAQLVRLALFLSHDWL